MSIKVVGYSERGMMNALFYDLAFAARANPDQARAREMLTELLRNCKFPVDPAVKPQWEEMLSMITSAKVFIEQSFSDFGDLDALLLLDCKNDEKHAVLIEAKVATAKSRPKTIYDFWNELHRFRRGEVKFRSSLFVQLARKFALVDRHVEDAGETEEHPDRTVPGFRLGRNRIILKAAKELQAYSRNPWFIALVPDHRDTVQAFFEQTLIPNRHALAGRDHYVDCLGYLTWPKIKEHCKEPKNERDWRHTLEAFEWNEEQIFETRAAEAAAQAENIQIHTLCQFGGQHKLVVWARGCHRWLVPFPHDGPYFPHSIAVQIGNVEPLNLPAQEIVGANYHPQNDMSYSWDPPVGQDPQPPDGEPVPRQAGHVTVIRRGPETSRVSLDGDAPANTFRVYNHHLLRNV